MKTPKIIEYLAEKIMEAHKKRVAEDSMQNYLEENLRDTEKAISNLISCMEQGIVSNSTQQSKDFWNYRASRCFGIVRSEAIYLLMLAVCLFCLATD